MQLDVPYIKQATDWSCAIASAEMVLRFFGLQDFDQTAIYKKLKKPTPGMPGQWCVYNDDLINELRAHGFEADYILFNYTNPADMMTELKNHLDSEGTPLIATQRAALNYPAGHSRVIVGYENATSSGKEACVLVHDPSTFIRQGYPRGGKYVKWTATNFANFWKPKGQIVTGGMAARVRKKQP